MNHSRLVDRICGVYRLMLAAYPAGFRAQYGGDMIQVLRDKCQSVLAGSGPKGLAAYFLCVLLDTITSSIRERADALWLSGELAGSGVLAEGDVPTFYMSKPEVPRVSALVHGFGLSILVFLAISAAIYQPAPYRCQARSAADPVNRNSLPLGQPAGWPALSLSGLLAWDSAGLNSSAAAESILAQFDHADIVALGVTHGSRMDQELSNQLLRNPEFRRRVRNVVVEWGNSLHQDVLDRYLAGEQVPADELVKVWRDTTQSPVVGRSSCSACVQLLEEVRSFNGQSPASQRSRVIAGDPPIDWERVTTAGFSQFLNRRDEVAAEIIQREILQRGQKALVIYGAGHVWRGNRLVMAPNLVSILDRSAPGRVRAVIRLAGIYRGTEQLDGMIGDTRRPTTLTLALHPAGKLIANEFIGRDIPVKLFSDGWTLAQAANLAIYYGRKPDTSLEPDPIDESEKAFASELMRRRSLMPGVRR